MGPETLLYGVLMFAAMFIAEELLATALRNWLVQRSFKKRSRNLPIASGAGLFGGHLSKLIATKRSWKLLDELHQKLGKTFGMFYCDQPVVSTIDLDLIKTMVIERPNDHVNRLKYNTPIREVEEDSLLTSKEKQWRHLRNLIAPAFTKSKIMMPNVQLEIQKVIDQLIDSFELRLGRAKSGRSVTSIKLNMDDMFLRYANALVFSCLYKQEQIIDFHSEFDPTTVSIDRAFKTCLDPILRFCIMFPVFSPIINWLMSRFHPIGVLQNQLRSFVKKQTLLNLKARQQLKKAELKCPADSMHKASGFDPDNFVLKSGVNFRRNMIDYVTDQFHDGKLTTSEYLNNSFFLFLASSKTSADSISKLLYNLASNPAEQEKLRSSILAEGVESEYLHWSIMESLRLFPPVPGGCSRTISYDMETKDGILIPSGTNIHTPVNIINRLKEYWGQDANEFKPERWRDSATFHPVQFLAFGAGKRKCFGGDFAIAEMKMLMSALLHRYRFKCSPETNADTIMEFDTFIVFTISHCPTNLEVSRI